MKPGMAKVKRIEGVLAPVITPFTRDYAPDAQRGGRREGVAAPVMPPFTRDYAPDAQRFVRHCRWLLKSGCAGLAVFGTNSEANSMAVAAKRALLEALGTFVGECGSKVATANASLIGRRSKCGATEAVRRPSALSNAGWSMILADL